MIYTVEKEKLYHKDIGEYTTFGLRACCKGKCVAFISDVSVDERFVTELAERFTAAQLSVIHLKEVIDDILP